MLSILKWMNAIWKNLKSLFDLLTCCKFVDLKKKSFTYSKQVKYPPQVFLMGKGCPTKKKSWGWEFPWKPKSLNFPFLLNITPTKKLSPPVAWSQIIYWNKKVSIVFRQILSKLLPEACIFSNIIMNYLKKLVGTKFLNTKQCPTGLSPRIMPHCPPNIQKIYSFTPPEKSPLLNLLLPLSKVSFLPHEIVIFI